MPSDGGAIPRCIAHLHYPCPAVHAQCFTRTGGAYPPDSSHWQKVELLPIEGIIEEILPDGRFAVRLDNEHKIIAYTAGKMRKFRIRSVVGDRVHLEMTPYDLTKGRIVFRERGASQAGAAKRRTNFR